MKILIIGPSWVGDMVMSQSLYITLKKKHPDATIDVLAPAWCKPILERMPQINKAIEMPVGHASLDLKMRWRIGRQLKQAGYTHAFVQPNSAKSALIPLFAGIKKRIGWKGEMRYGLLTDIRPNKRVFNYWVERHVALAYPKATMTQDVHLANCPYPQLTVDKSTQKRAMERLQLPDQRTIIGMCPGAEFGPAKRWPDEYYAQVAEHVIEQGKQVWLFGSQKDDETTSKILNSLPIEQQEHCFNLAGKTSLIEAVDLLAACDTVVCNDSGLMHVAAAVGCHIIAVYGSTSPEYTPPMTDKAQIASIDLECRPCFRRECPLGHLNCLKQLPPQTVIDLIK